MLVRVVRRELRNRNHELVEKLGRLGQLVAMHVRLAIGPGLFVGRNGVRLSSIIVT